MMANCAASGSGVLGKRVCRFIWIGVDKDVRSSSSAYHCHAQGWEPSVTRLCFCVCVCVCSSGTMMRDWQTISRMPAVTDATPDIPFRGSDGVVSTMPTSTGPQDTSPPPPPPAFKQRPRQRWHQLPTDVGNRAAGKTNKVGRCDLVPTFRIFFCSCAALLFFIWLWWSALELHADFRLQGHFRFFKETFIIT